MCSSFTPDLRRQRAPFYSRQSPENNRVKYALQNIPSIKNIIRGRERDANQGPFSFVPLPLALDLCSRRGTRSRWRKHDHKVMSLSLSASRGRLTKYIKQMSPLHPQIKAISSVLLRVGEGLQLLEEEGQWWIQDERRRL